MNILNDTCDGVLVLSELGMRNVWSSDVPYTHTVIYQQATTTKNKQFKNLLTLLCRPGIATALAKSYAPKRYVFIDNDQSKH